MAADASVQAAPAALAKGALRRLALAQQEPTPENFARAYAEEASTGAVAAGVRSGAAAVAWPTLIERLVRGLERGGKQWTAARRKESLQRVLDSSRSDEERLALRLMSLLQAWEGDRPPERLDALDSQLSAAGVDGAEGLPAGPGAGGSTTLWASDSTRALVSTFNDTVRAGLGETEPQAAALSRRLGRLAQAWAGPDAAAAVAQDLGDACAEARRWFGQRHELVRQLSALTTEMSEGLVELAEDETWTRGQCEALRAQLAESLDVRSLRAAGAALADTRTRQAHVKRERLAARTALKQLLAGMIGEVGALQQQAGGFESAIERHAAAVQAADSLEGLASVVQAMLDDSRQIRGAIGASHQRLQHDSDRAGALQARVRELESELCRLSDEARTDALTQVANRRGLEQLFAGESERAVQAQAPLALGLIDIDNFKKLNDRLGHAAGDHALKALAAAVRERLRPEDHVARFGGEEFVVLLRGLPLAQAQQALTRLQRGLSASLFLHEGEEVFVTFSAGVTLWRPGEAMQAALERADAGLYEAKRGGKNRTCAT